MTEYSITPRDDMQSAVDRLKPGDVLVLEEGIFTQPIQPRTGVAGRADARITIRAAVEGSVLIDGEGKHARPVFLDYAKGNDYFEIIGINAANGLGYTIDMSGTRNIARRVIAWNAIESDEGQQTWRANGYNGLIEDCGAFGGRYCLGPNQMGNNAPADPMTTFRRCVMVYTNATISSPKASAIYWYNSDPVLWEYCITTWAAGVAPNSQGLFYCATADPYVHGGQTILRSCIAYLKAKQPAPAAISGFSAQGNRRITLENCAAYMSPEHPANGLKAFDLRAASVTQSGPPELHIKNCTGIGPDSDIHPDWQQENVVLAPDQSFYSDNGTLWNNDGEGACINPQGFLPHPMNDRIWDAMLDAGLTPIDITADLEEIFGEVPGGSTPNPTPPTPSDDWVQVPAWVKRSDIPQQ